MLAAEKIPARDDFLRLGASRQDLLKGGVDERGGVAGALGVGQLGPETGRERLAAVVAELGIGQCEGLLGEDRFGASVAFRGVGRIEEFGEGVVSAGLGKHFEIEGTAR